MTRQAPLKAPTDTARPADAAAHAGSHADSDVRQLEVHRVVTVLRTDSMQLLPCKWYCSANLYSFSMILYPF